MGLLNDPEIRLERQIPALLPYQSRLNQTTYWKRRPETLPIRQ